jgi:hypothetical protein
MPYSAQITRTNPACFLFLIDQSESMGAPFAEGLGDRSKATIVADAVNRLLQNLVLRSAKAGGVQDYFHVGVIGYGKTVRAGFGGKLPFEVTIPISRIGEYPLRVEKRTKLVPDGAGGVVEQSVKFPVWYDPESEGATPMCEAMSAAGLVVHHFIEKYPESYPPIVLNMSDGIPSDGNPQSIARTIRKMTTSNGNALLFNLLLSTKLEPPVCFPSDETLLSENSAKLLFRMSSELPEGMWEAARIETRDLKPRARGVVLNADPTALVRFLDIGTRVTPKGVRS